MFFDPTIRPTTKTDPLTVAAFIAWLEQQPVDRKYNWPDIHGCLLCLYLRETFDVAQPAAEEWNGAGGIGSSTLGPNWGYHAICEPRPWTFGAALARARALACASS